MTEFMEGSFDFEPYEVKCARCGKVGLCTDFMIEEGDEWECPECWLRCENTERAARGLPPLK